MGWRTASQPNGASAGHPIEIAGGYLTRGRSVFKLGTARAADRLNGGARLQASCTPAGAGLSMRHDFAGLRAAAEGRPEARMVPFFVQIKCQLGQSYEVANRLADAEIASEIYSTAGEFDLLVKFYLDDKIDIGHFVNEQVQTIPG